MGLYDGYRLANSKATIPYLGSTMDELTKVSDIMQQRYDQSEFGMDALSDAMKNASVLPNDRDLFDSRTQQYKDQIGQWSQRKDLENVTRDVARAGRQYAGEYRNFASNEAAYSSYVKDTEKAVDDKRISRTRANKLIAASRDIYSGLQYDKNTGEYSNPFVGIGAANEINDADWLKKTVGDAVAREGKSLVSGVNGDYIVKNGSSYEVLTPAQIKQYIDAGFANDESIQADYKQRAQLAGWEIGKRTKMEDYPEHIQNAIKQSGLSLDEYMERATLEDQKNNLYALGYKYAKNNRESSSELSGLSREGSRPFKPDTLLSLSAITPGTGVGVKSATEFEHVVKSNDDDLNQVVQNYADWLKGKTKVGDQVYTIDQNGKKANVTDKANEYRQQIDHMKIDADNLESIRKDAMKVSGYDPNKPGSIGVEANRIYEEYRKNPPDIVVEPGRGKIPAKTRSRTPAEAEEFARNSQEQYLQDHKKEFPGYDVYEQAIKNRLNKDAETSSIALIQDPEVRKAWSDNLTAMTSDLGLKNGAVSFTIGSGPDQGKPITAGQYNSIKGNIEVVGFESDANGNTQIKVRAYKDIQGKKTAGKDLLLNLGSTDVDKWMVKNMDPQAFLAFKQEAAMKAHLHNDAREADIEIPGTNQSAHVYLKNNQWVVSLPGQGGVNEQLADSYSGIVNIINQASKLYK